MRSFNCVQFLAKPFLLFLALQMEIGCSDGRDALYDPEETQPLSLELQVLNNPSDSQFVADSSGWKNLFAPCTLKLVPRVTSQDQKGKTKVWTSEEIVVQLRTDYQWLLVKFNTPSDTTYKFGFAPLLDCNELPLQSRAHFIMIDSKRDTLRDSLSLHVIPSNLE
jgi:hypothetical protein